MLLNDLVSTAKRLAKRAGLGCMQEGGLKGSNWKRVWLAETSLTPLPVQRPVKGRHHSTE